MPLDGGEGKTRGGGWGGDGASELVGEKSEAFEVCLAMFGQHFFFLHPPISRALSLFSYADFP